MTPLRAFLLVLPAAWLTACPPTEPDGRVTDAGFVALDGGFTPLPCNDPGFARCDGECVPLLADARNCGACGNACPAGGVCANGTCGCAGKANCGDVCANLDTDADHCGACGNACAGGEACFNGSCVLACTNGLTKCDRACVDLTQDEQHCGACGRACADGQSCEGGVCRCPEGTRFCDGSCVDTSRDSLHCGGCGTQCYGGFSCKGGQCVCPPTSTMCGISCVDVSTDMQNCGGCNNYCQAGQTCMGGNCITPCPAGQLRCGALCVDVGSDPAHCGACGNSCGGLSCIGGACVVCNSATTDCDGDGWMVSDGDCCDQPGGCGNRPALVNPGAFEIPNNGIDDNCNGLVDGADKVEISSCDLGLASNSFDPLDYAKAFGICRTTTESPPLAQRTWGLISAHLLKADGSPLNSFDGVSLRGNFGSALKPREGTTMVVLSSGKAADQTQTNPGPNNGPNSTSQNHGSSTGVNIKTCTQPWCVADWLNTGNPPLKLAGQLPAAPGCNSGAFGTDIANDSVMLALRLRAPTNARAFQFGGYFLSSEYPEYVCSSFNDQLVALVDTPGGSPAGVVNPVDKNLMTYFNAGSWPVGINVAKGTGLFKVCETQAQNPTCWDPDVSPLSCSEGKGELAGTGFGTMTGSSCLNGGGTGWLVTSGNVRPGEIVELRMALWDVGDHSLDSTALLDGFRWLENPTQAGTTD